MHVEEEVAALALLRALDFDRDSPSTAMSAPSPSVPLQPSHSLSPIPEASYLSGVRVSPFDHALGRPAAASPADPPPPSRSRILR